MERETLSDRLRRKVQPVSDCFSVALSQAREAEIDVPSKRSFRKIHGSGNGDGEPSQDGGNGAREVAPRTGPGGRSILDCLDNARSRAQIGITDVSMRRSYRKLPE